MEGNKIGYLVVGQFVFFHEGYWATDDCHALLEGLALPLARGYRWSYGTDAQPKAW